jgi:hypothetical protein
MAGAGSWLRDRLEEGDRRIPAAAGAVADRVLADTALLPDLIDLLDDDNTAVVSHAAHAAMQISAKIPALFDPHVEQLIGQLEALRQWEIGEQLPKILIRVNLTEIQAGRIGRILRIHLGSEFNIVAACSLQGIVDLARDGRIAALVASEALDLALMSERKALSARARRLQKQFEAIR